MTSTLEGLHFRDKLLRLLQHPERVRGDPHFTGEEMEHGELGPWLKVTAAPLARLLRPRFEQRSSNLPKVTELTD